jgi:two-component system, cell cycle response regulator DivK
MLKMSPSKIRMPDNPMILIVEDNRVNQLLLMKKFEQQGFHSLLLAKNGQEAIDLALKNNPDLILMDIQLPDMNGNAVMQSLRNSKFTGQMVAVSADAAKEDMDKSFAAGANGYITKPINFDTFFTTISEFLKLKDDQGKTPPAQGKEKKIIPTASRPDKIDSSISAAAKNVFIIDGQEKLQILAAALEHSDDENQMAKIKAIAHEYKGNAGYFGLKELESIARELDMSISNNQPQEELIKLTQRLVAVVKEIVDETA